MKYLKLTLHCVEDIIHTFTVWSLEHDANN